MTGWQGRLLQLYRTRWFEQMIKPTVQCITYAKTAPDLKVFDSGFGYSKHFPGAQNPHTGVSLGAGGDGLVG